MATAASLLSFSSIGSPNPSFTRYKIGRRPIAVLSRFSVPSSNPNLSRGFVTFGGKSRWTKSAVAATDESTHPEIKVEKEKDELKKEGSKAQEAWKEHPEIEVEKEKDELKKEGNEAQEAWKEALESFKVEALKMKEISQEAYEVYSKKAAIILKETSETLKIQAGKAQQDLSVLAKQISEEGKVYLSVAAENSPESIKDVMETLASSGDETKNIFSVREFYLGIPYGVFLSVGGFLFFMMTGSIAAVRFGVILGGALLALSVASLRSWKRGESSVLYLKGQAAIATVIFIHKWQVYCQTRSFLNAPLALISGAMLAFYIYRLAVDGLSKDASSEHS